MDDPSPIARLTEAGALDIALSATIRPPAQSGHDTALATGDTVLADDDLETADEPRSLPRISVDLRGTLSPDEAPKATADLEVRHILGEGGMGRVFLARQHSLVRDVAVKTVKDGATRAAARALLFEGVICGQLEHPSIVPVHALGLDQAERPALVMKRIEGVTWDTLLRDPAHPLWESWSGDEEDRLLGHLEILTQVCNAVHYGHSRGIVHRDLKPENILIGGFGDVYVADWGVAAHMDSPTDTRLCGTPGYMPPEMVRGEAVDERTDVYLLGALLHELLTGEMRHEAATSAEALALSLVSAAATYGPTIATELGELANRACHAEPGARPASAKAFRDALAAFLRHRTSIQLTAKATERLERVRSLHEEAKQRRERHPDESEVDDDADSRRELERLAAEARFGLEQAQEEWPENPKAKEALLALEDVLEERRLHAEALERLALERDPRVGQRQRTFGLLLIALVGFVITGDIARRVVDLTMSTMFAYSAALFIFVLSVVIALRRRVLRNAFGRQVAATILVGSFLITAPRLVTMFFPVDVASALARDMFTITAACAVLSITLAKEAAAMFAVSLAGGLAIIVLPAHASGIFGTTTSLLFVAAAILSHRTTVESTRGFFS